MVSSCQELQGKAPSEPSKPSEQPGKLDDLPVLVMPRKADNKKKKEKKKKDKEDIYPTAKEEEEGQRLAWSPCHPLVRAGCRRIWAGLGSAIFPLNQTPSIQSPTRHVQANMLQWMDQYHAYPPTDPRSYGSVALSPREGQRSEPCERQNKN